MMMIVPKQHEVTSITRCKSCGNTNTIIKNDILISIPINKCEKKSYDLQDLLNVMFSHWCQLSKSIKSCENCTENDILFKNELTLAGDIIVIHLISIKDDKLAKIDKFTLRAVPTTKVMIAGQLYKIMNAIFHHGQCIEKGHYISICRENMSNSWIEVDDSQIKKRQWPRGAKDICIIFLQKIDK